MCAVVHTIVCVELCVLLYTPLCVLNYVCAVVHAIVCHVLHAVCVTGISVGVLAVVGGSAIITLYLLFHQCRYSRMRLPAVHGMAHRRQHAAPSVYSSLPSDSLSSARSAAWRSATGATAYHNMAIAGSRHPSTYSSKVSIYN